MINLSKIIFASNKPNLVIQNLDMNIGHKLYLPINVSFLNSNYHRIGGLLDTGADLCIMQSTYFFKLFKEFKEEKLVNRLEKSSFSLTSYTDHKIRVLGLAKMSLRFNPQLEAKEIDIYIVHTDNNDKCKSPVIFSFKVLSEFGLTMNFKNIENLIVPNIYRDDCMIPSYFNTDAQLSISHGYVDNLEPRATKHVYFVVSPVSPFLPGDAVVLTQDSVPYQDQRQIRITPSTSILEFVGSDLVAHGVVQNLGRKQYTGTIKGSIEAYEKEYTLQTLEKNTLEQDSVSIINECNLSPFKSSVMNININQSLEGNLKSKHKTKIFSKENKKSIKAHLVKQKSNDDTFIGKIQNVDSYLNHQQQIVDPKLYNININFPEFSPSLSNPDCENNDVKDFSKSLSEERHNIKESSGIIPKNELNEFYDKNKTIQIGFNDNLGDITKDDLEPRGLGIPNNLIEQPEDIIVEENYEPIIWPYIKQIFLEKYPEVISRHSLDRGEISNSLGTYNIVLKPHTTLPRFKKLYYMDPKSSSQMRDILEFLCKTRVIAKAPCSGGDGNSFASPAFLVARSNDQQSARIVVNFMYLNKCLVIEPITLSNFDFILNQLSDACLFTCIDLKSAFQSVSISAESAKYTTFSTIYGSYNFLVLPTGLACSPNSLARFCDKMLHHEVVRNDKNEVMYDDKGYPLMEPSKIIGCEIYYDDILCFTKAEPTYAGTVKKHFDLVKKVIQRLHFHKAKIEMAKANFAKHRISFLGWLIGNNYLIADPRRIEKLISTPFPMSVKAMRSYLGLLNCLRNTLNFTILRKVHLLTPLTSSKIQVYKPTEIQKSTFHEINKQLTSAPLYSKLVIPSAPKLLFTDSASESYSQFSCVLAQIVKAKNPKTSVPYYLLLDDLCDQIIYDEKLPVRPVPLMEDNETNKDYLKRINNKDPPSLDYYKENTLGYKDKVNNSLGITLRHMLIVHNCTQSYLEVCEKLCESIKGTIYNEQIIDISFSGDLARYKLYLSDVKAGLLVIDEGLHIFQALGEAQHRTITVINSTDLYNKEKVITFNPGKPKPPFFFKLYRREGKLITRPLKLDPHSEYNYGKHAGGFEVILYHSKTIPESFKNLSIFHLELYALLSSLEACKKLVGKDELLALVDNRCLYYLYHSEVQASYSKMVRWGAKIKESFPLLKLHFVSSAKNISDFLSRQMQVSKSDLKQIKLPNYVSSLLDEHIPQNAIFSVDEWISWVQANPQFLEHVAPKEKRPESDNLKALKSSTDMMGICKIKLDILASKLNNKADDLPQEYLGMYPSENFMKRNSNAFYSPIRSLEKILTIERIIQEQKLEYNEIYKECLENLDNKNIRNNTTYVLLNGILHIEKGNTGLPRLYIPSVLLPMYIGMAHLSSNHAGAKSMILALTNYYHERLQKLCEKYAKSCLACILVNHPNRQERLGTFPLDAQPGEVLHLDLCESIGVASGFQHLLTVKCPISQYIKLIPMRSKRADEFIYIFQNNIWPQFHPRAVYTDNAGFFISEATITALAKLRTEVIYSSAFASFSHGNIERLIKHVKIIFKKLLTAEPSYNWTLMPAITSVIHNTSKTPKSGFSPSEILYGPDTHLSNNFLNMPFPTIHPYLRQQAIGLKDQHERQHVIFEENQDKITNERDDRINRLNKNKISKDLEIGDIIFAKDESKPVGRNRSLKSYYHPSPFIILYKSPVSLIIKRIADHLVIRRNKGKVKKYIPFDKEFESLPAEVKRICEQDKIELSQKDLDALIKNEDFDIEKFFDTEPNDQLDTLNLINEFDQSAPLEEINEEEVKEQLLGQDNEDDIIGVKTRGQIKRDIEKRVRFQKVGQPNEGTVNNIFDSSNF